MVYSMNAFGQNELPNQNYIQGNNNFNQYQNAVITQNQSSNKVPFLGVTALGGITGAGIGFFKNNSPVSKNGKVSDTFAQKAFDKHIKNNLSKDGKEFFTQVKNILSKIDSVKTVEDFKKLLNNNKKVCSTDINGFSADSILKTLTTENVKSKASALKSGLQHWLDYNVKNMKDSISACWDKESKKFVKPNNMDDKIFKTIKNTGTNSKTVKILKHAGIGAAIAGGLAIVYNLFASRFTSRQ